jgi:hypothetical protein
LFFDKKDLNNGIDWFIPCAMNTNEISSNADFRLNRIKTASRIFRWLLNGYILFVVLNVILFVCATFWNLGVSQGVEDIWHIDPDRVSDFWRSASNIPELVPGLVLLKTTVLGGCVLVLNKLFRLYEHGRFFSRDHVRQMQGLGCLIVVNWATAMFLNAMSNGYSEYHFHFAQLNWIGALQLFILPIAKDMSGNNDIGFMQPVIGVLIIFIAWVMDEGRKIQEEQELTV